jgi:hypothetical protein
MILLLQQQSRRHPMAIKHLRGVCGMFARQSIDARFEDPTAKARSFCPAAYPPICMLVRTIPPVFCLAVWPEANKTLWWPMLFMLVSSLYLF